MATDLLWKACETIPILMTTMLWTSSLDIKCLHAWLSGSTLTGLRPRNTSQQSSNRPSKWKSMFEDLNMVAPLPRDTAIQAKEAWHSCLPGVAIGVGQLWAMDSATFCMGCLVANHLWDLGWLMRLNLFKHQPTEKCIALNEVHGQVPGFHPPRRWVWISPREWEKKLRNRAAWWCSFGCITNVGDMLVSLWARYKCMGGRPEFHNAWVSMGLGESVDTTWYCQRCGELICLSIGFLSLCHL